MKIMKIMRLKNGVDHNGNLWPAHYIETYEQCIKDVERAAENSDDDYLKEAELIFMTAQARRYYTFVSNSLELAVRTIN